MAERNKSRVQMIGSEAELSKGPGDMRQSAFPGGTAQMIGSEAELVHQTTPMGVFDKHVRGGRMQFTGSMAEVSRSATRGWESYDTPVSDNSQASMQSISGYPGSRPRRMRE